MRYRDNHAKSTVSSVLSNRLRVSEVISTYHKVVQLGARRLTSSNMFTNGELTYPNILVGSVDECILCRGSIIGTQALAGMAVH